MGRSSHFSETMTQCVRVAVPFFLILSHVMAADAAISSAYDSPATNLTTCVIRATLYATSPLSRSSQDFGLPLDIDCSVNGTLEGSPFDLSVQRVSGKKHVRLDGTQTPPLGIQTYGLEYLDNCAHLESLEIELFVGDSSLELSCNGAMLGNLTTVSFRDNELGTLSSDTFLQMPRLRSLNLQKNSLKYMEIMRGFDSLEELIIKDETDLTLGDKDLILNPFGLKRLHLTRLNKIQSNLFGYLPESLTDLVVRDTPIEPGELYLERGIFELVNLTIANCQLKRFALNPPVILKMQYLNLSGNALKSLSYGCSNCSLFSSNLETLDLSKNQLEFLNPTWFSRMIVLKWVYLNDNRFRTLSLFDLLQIAPFRVQQFDLRSNRIMSFKEEERASHVYWLPLRLLVDANPWSCQWLLNFSHAHPMLFRMFQYTKYISHINVNGLSCEPQEAPTAPPPKLERIMQVRINGSSAPDVPVPHPNTNVSSFTVLYGNPVELHRSQRNGALIIVFMLPLGIALLFLLLYLYLHCERLFHLSYYVSGLPCFGDEKQSSAPRFVDHVDVVRYPVANGGGAPVDVETELPDGYETPVSGAASICNCTGHRESACSRTHHVTYETLPAELPYQLYAEIKEHTEEEVGSKETDGMMAATAPIYDHLSFVEEIPKPEELRDIS
ncbi:hypothetical protein KR018_006199 [Drosophila ironensis]|nr:hypothetical protein KR018_006199 [Drosophila ironensis]